MASGGSSVQSAAGSRSFDFGSDDLLCSFEDYTLLLDPMADGKRLNLSAKDFHENRVRSPLANVYGEPEEFSREDLIYAVEKCMKKFADKLTTHLEGISGRLTQLELHCYKLERSISEFHTDTICDQSEADLKLRSLKKHVHEVHRSVQIILDKQELSETQKELTKLELSQKNNEDLNSATSENKAKYESTDVPNQQLSFALPYQISSPPPSIAITAPDKNHPEKEQLPVQQSLPVPLTVFPRDHYVLNQANSYYYSHQQQLLLEQQSQNLQPELHNAQLMVKMHDLSLQTPPAYAAAYAPPNQHANKIPESHQFSSILLPSPYSAPQSESYGDSNNTISLLQPQHNMQQQPLPLPHASQGYVRTNTYPSQSNMLGYNAVYVIDGNRASHLQSCHIGSCYPPNGNLAASLISSNHPYGDMTEKAVGIVLHDQSLT